MVQFYQRVTDTRTQALKIDYSTGRILTVIKDQDEVSIYKEHTDAVPAYVSSLLLNGYTPIGENTFIPLLDSAIDSLN